MIPFSLSSMTSRTLSEIFHQMSTVLFVMDWLMYT
jgi:hypothetical protein